MGQVLNLRQARKRAARRDEEQRAAGNRLLHGTSKTERDLRKARDAKSRGDLDRHQVQKGECDEIAGH